MASWRLAAAEIVKVERRAAWQPQSVATSRSSAAREQNRMDLNSDHHVGGFHNRAHRLADLQSEGMHARLGDGGDDHGTTGQLDLHFAVDGSILHLDDLAPRSEER